MPYRHPGIDLSGLAVLMAKVLLDDGHLDTGIHRMGGQGMPEDVAGPFALNPGPGQIPLHKA